MLYRPVSLVIVERVPSIITGLETSTATPGRTAPVASFTCPAIELCPKAAGAARMRTANTVNPSMLFFCMCQFIIGLPPGDRQLTTGRDGRQEDESIKSALHKSERHLE